ncbi:MAG TPA: MarR family winged helix-turn-helix transcriptional regulator [Pirellulales bacterium]
MPQARSQTEPPQDNKYADMVANCACFHLRKASRTVTQLFDQILAPCGLRSTQLTILLAAKVVGPCGLARLARELVMDRSTITRNLLPLVKQGYLKVSGSNGRSGKSVEITAIGMRALATAEPYWNEAQNRLVNRVGHPRWNHMMGELTHVVDSSRASS